LYPFHRQNRQIAAPKTFPMLAVRAIAKAPQNVTRTVARKTFAPRALAPMAVCAENLIHVDEAPKLAKLAT
jgi:hypothetical protein